MKWIDRFEAKIRREPDNGCWIWTAAKVQGYGIFRIGSKTYRAHRISFELHTGQQVKDLHICHLCDNPSCVNPAHLFAGTPADNMADKVAKGRQSRGEKISNSKLTKADVLAIRADKRFNAVIARQYGVQRRAIDRIKKKERWAHV